MPHDVGPDYTRINRTMRLLRWIILPGALLSLPLYVFVYLGGASSEKLAQLPDLFDRIKEPITCEVAADGVRYTRFFHAQADTGRKFVVVRLRLEARIRIGYRVVPRCFRLVDDLGIRHYPLSRSPIFIRYGDVIALDRGTVLEGELLFDLPGERKAKNLLFDRYQK